MGKSLQSLGLRMINFWVNVCKIVTQFKYSRNIHTYVYKYLLSVSCAEDGTLYQWDVAEGKRLHETVVKTCVYSDVSIAPDSSGLIYAVGSDKTIKQMDKMFNCCLFVCKKNFFFIILCN